MAKKLKWGTIKNLKQLVNEYIKEAEHPNPAGLCLKLGIHKDTWHYYTSDVWRTNRLEGDELEEKNRQREKEIEDGILEQDEIEYLEEFDQSDRRLNETLKSQVSEVLKIAKTKMEEYNANQIYEMKNPAGAIFIAKAVYGYRENPPDDDKQGKLPAGNIIINILPPPANPTPVQVIDVTPEAIPEKL